MGRTEFADRLRPSLGSIVLALVPPLQRKWRRPCGTRFRRKTLPGEQMSDDLGVGRTRRQTWNESIGQQNQPTRQTTLYVPLCVFFA